MFVVIIKDLEVQLGNSNLLIGKNVICFKFLAEKRETGKQTASAFHIKNYKSVS